MWRDFRFALRLLRAHPGTSTLAVLTLALGIGATVTVFGLFDALFLRTLSVPSPGRLVRLQLVTPDGRTQNAFSYPFYLDVRDTARAFTAVAGYTESQATVRIGEYADRLPIESVTSDYFALLGAPPALGRAFSRDEERSRAAVTVLSHDLWRRVFRADPGALGASVLLGGRPFTVIGVAREGFHGARQAAAPALWVPAPWMLAFVGMPDFVNQRGVGFLGLIARLTDDVEPAGAAAEVTALAKRVEEEFGDNRIAALPAPRGDDAGVEDLAGAARLVAAAALLLLLMACVNVMHILLTRGEGRRREVAIRLALGGSRLAVLRQFLVESSVIAALAAAGGVLLAAWALELVPRTAAFRAAGVHIESRLDARVLAAAVVAGFGSALIAGLLPAWRAGRQSVMQSIRRAAGPNGRWRAGGALAVGQVALSLLLLAAAGLFARSLSTLRATETNLAADRVVALQAQFGLDTTAEQLRGASQRLLDALRSMPGVRSAALATTLPVSTSGMQQRFDAGTTVPGADTDVQVELQFVSPGYFETIGLPLVEGRTFPADTGVPGAIVVNEGFARRYWPGRSGLGRTFTQKSRTGEDDVFTVAGVARDTKYRSLDEPAGLVMYRPLAGFPSRSLAALVRVDGAPGALTGTIRQRLLASEPGLTVWNVRPLRDHIEASLAFERARTATLTAFAGLALVLVCLGVYGIMAYSVSRRTREIAIRLALGAEPRSVRALVLRHALVLVGTGVLIGLLGVYVAGALVKAQLHGIAHTDPVSLGGSAVVLLLVAAAASSWPARRASRVDPMAVLPFE